MHFQKYFPRKGLTKLENHRKSDLIGDPAGADRPADRVCKGCARRCLFVLSGLLPRGAGRGLLGLRAGAHRAVGGAGGRAGAVVFLYAHPRVHEAAESAALAGGRAAGGERGAVRVCRAVGAQPFRPLRRADAGAGRAGVFQAGAHRRHGLLCRPGERIRRPRRPRCRRQDRLSRLFRACGPGPGGLCGARRAL